MTFQIVDRKHPKRALVEAQIRGVYADVYGAELTDFPDTLVALVDEDGLPTVAAGIRLKEDGFFSENYLARPVEEVLTRIWKRPVRRHQIAEISNLAGCKSGASLRLMQYITQYLRDEGVTWAVFTATQRLRAMLRRTGVPALDVGPARRECVPNPEQWGGYNDAMPRVCAIHDHMVTVRTPADEREPVAALA